MMAVQTSPDSEVILNRALTACPHDAQLYYFAARLELLALSSDSKLDVAECSQRAIEWLERCIRSFYKSPTSSVDSSHLYRYVSYNYTIAKRTVWWKLVLGLALPHVWVVVVNYHEKYLQQRKSDTLDLCS